MLGGGDVAVLAWDLLGDGCLCAGGEGAGAGWVDDRGVGAGAVSGDDVDGSAEASTWGDLWESGAGLSHDGGLEGRKLVLFFGIFVVERKLTMPARVLAPAFVFPSPSVAAALDLNTVVSTSVTAFFPGPGTTPPWIPRPVVFPPASPVCE